MRHAERWRSALHGARDPRYVVWNTRDLSRCSSLGASALFKDMVGLYPQKKGCVHVRNIITVYSALRSQ